MERSVESTEEQAVECVHERLLLHWVNSLPLTKCLLVEELRDLRFGDVLLEIVSWLQRSPADTEAACALEYDAFENSEVVEQLRRVVQFVASECRSQDGNAMYIVNDTNCVAQVMAGQSDALCAVLTVLKRLGVQRLHEQKKFDSDMDTLRRRQVEQELMKHSLHSRDNITQDNVAQEKMTRSFKDAESERKVKRVQPSSSRTQNLEPKKSSTSIRAKSVPSKPKETTRSRKRPTAAPKRRISSNSPSAGPPSTNSKKIISGQTGIYRDEKGLRVYGMLDPTAKYQPGGEANDGSRSDDEVAVRICNWVQLVLQVEIPMNQFFVTRTEKWRLSPPRKVRQVFASGVLLCRIAAAIIQRCGAQADLNISELEKLSFAPLSDPQTPEERRRNLALALAAFKRFQISPEALDSFASLQYPGKTVSIWSALDEVFNRVEQLAHAAAPSNARHTGSPHSETFHTQADLEKAMTNEKATTYEKPTTGSALQKKADSSPKHTMPPQVRREMPVVAAISSQSVPLKRNIPYITIEQIQVVNEWLTRVGLEVQKSSGRGVQHDPMRNGVLLCSLLTQVLKKTSFSYFKVPRTLRDMRENISTVFKRLGDFPQEQIPQCYLTAAAEQAILIGDRQICYGILWHLWQTSHSKPEPTSCDGGKSLPTDLHETRAAVGVVVPSTPAKTSPLLLDIPAVTLAEQGKLTLNGDVKTSFFITPHDRFARRLAWNDQDLNGNQSDDDVFPVPRVPFSSPVYSAGVDSELSWIGKENEDNHSDTDDILPVVSPRTIHPDPVDSPTQSNDVLSPVKTLADHGEQYAKQSQGSEDKILAWLMRLGIHLKEASSFHDPSAKLTEFQSGVLLCCIVEKVEFMRSIPGITRPSGKNQLGKASALHNISKALAILQQKKTMPLHLLRRANAIYTGNRSVILRLLLQICKAYGHHHVRRAQHPKPTPNLHV